MNFFDADMSLFLLKLMRYLNRRAPSQLLPDISDRKGEDSVFNLFEYGDTDFRAMIAVCQQSTNNSTDDCLYGQCAQQDTSLKDSKLYSQTANQIEIKRDLWRAYKRSVRSDYIACWILK